MTGITETKRNIALYWWIFNPCKIFNKPVFDLEDNDVFAPDKYCIYLFNYGPLANGATIFMYEGTPDYPHNGQFWN